MLLFGLVWMVLWMLIGCMGWLIHEEVLAARSTQFMVPVRAPAREIVYVRYNYYPTNTYIPGTNIGSLRR